MSLPSNMAMRRYRGPDAGHWRLRRRIGGVAAIAIAAATIAFGETWLYRDAPAVTVESVIGDGIAHALDQELGLD